MPQATARERSKSETYTMPTRPIRRVLVLSVARRRSRELTPIIKTRTWLESGGSLRGLHDGKNGEDEFVFVKRFVRRLSVNTFMFQRMNGTESRKTGIWQTTEL